MQVHEGLFRQRLCDEEVPSELHEARAVPPWPVPVLRALQGQGVRVRELRCEVWQEWILRHHNREMQVHRPVGGRAVQHSRLPEQLQWARPLLCERGVFMRARVAAGGLLGAQVRHQVRQRRVRHEDWEVQV